MDFIELLPAKKDNLVSLLEELLSDDDNVFDFSRIDSLLTTLIDSVHFLIEFPYTDEHYRNSYYFYYAEKFGAYERDAKRVHVFAEEVDENSLARIREESYFGYFIVRPLNVCPLGHSFLSPKAFKNKQFLCCLTKSAVSILGNKFEIYAFPHVVQDSETQTCAESSLWSLLSYFGTKYHHYRPYAPSEIIEKLNSFSGHRMLPARGLSVEELTACLNSCGQRCVVYSSPDEGSDVIKNEKEKGKFFSLMRIYIESGMPFVVALENADSGHAVLAIGHEDFSPQKTIVEVKKDPCLWTDISFVNKKLVFIDDNFAPYVMDSCDLPAERYSAESGLRNMKISAFIVSFHRHMYMDALDAYSLMKKIFDDEHYGLMTFGTNKWITRLFLTKSRSFKREIASDEKVNSEIRDWLLKMCLPKYIWVCEIFSEESYLEQECIGILIIDSTGSSNSFNSVLVYYVDKFQMVHNGLLFTKRQRTEERFSKTIYRNNLNGEWSEWKDGQKKASQTL